MKEKWQKVYQIYDNLMDMIKRIETRVMQQLFNKSVA